MGLSLRRRTVLIGGIIWLIGGLIGQMTGPNQSSGAVVGVLFITSVSYAGVVLIGWTINNPNKIGHRVAVSTLITGLAFVVFALLGLLIDGANYRFFGFAGVIGGGFLSFSALLRSRLIGAANVSRPPPTPQDIVDTYKHLRERS